MQHNLNVPVYPQMGNSDHCRKPLSFTMVLNQPEHPKNPGTSKSSSYADTSLLTSDSKNWSLGNQRMWVQWCPVI